MAQADLERFTQEHLPVHSHKRSASTLFITGMMCLVMSGCASGSRTARKPPTIYAPSAAPAVSSSSTMSRTPARASRDTGVRSAEPSTDSSSTSIAFSSPASTTSPPHAPAKPSSPPVKAARSFNLYGELEGGAAGPDAGSQLDGSTNLVQVSFATEGACVDPDVDRSGNLLVFASTMHRRTSDIYLKSVNGKTLTQITSDPADDVMPAFSPDGTKIAFASNRAGNWDIYVAGIDGGPPTQISSENDPELHPTWSPDGRFLAYCRFGAQSARWEIWTTDVANPGVRHFLDYGVFPEWCPDVARNKIVFQRAKQRGSRDYSIWTIDITNGQATQPTEIVSAANAALINPGWSADGSRIVFVAVVDPQEDGARPKQSDVWIVNVDGSNRTNLTNGQFANFQPVWANDGSVFFVSDRSGVDNVWAVKAGLDKHQPTGMANADNGSPSEVPGQQP